MHKINNLSPCLEVFFEKFMGVSGSIRNSGCHNVCLAFCLLSVCPSVCYKQYKPSLSFTFPILSVSCLSLAPLAYLVGQMDYELEWFSIRSSIRNGLYYQSHLDLQFIGAICVWYWHWD